MAVEVIGQTDQVGGAGSTRPNAGGGSTARPVASRDGPSYADGIHDSFVLGWSIAELRGRVRVARINLADATRGAKDDGKAAADTTRSADLVQLESSISDTFWLASSWRLLFDRVSFLQRSQFPRSTTANTYYDPGDKLPPYLYPEDPIDYANIGISASDEDGKPLLEAFVLRGVTRRAMNCLTLLYLNPEISLLPDILRDRQNHLVKAILASVSKSTSPPTSSPDDPAGSIDPASQDLQTAIDLLTVQTIVFLDAWGTFIRESFYAAGISAQDETKLIAYEAGRAMAGLSWEITFQGVPLEADDDQAAGASDREAQLRALWLKAFDSRGISVLQHQVAVLGQALDEEYWARLGHLPPVDGDGPAPPNPALPSQILETVKCSLDYWERAVHWLTVKGNAPVNGMNANHWRSLRFALLEQTGNWRALVLGQQDLRTYTAENVVRQILGNAMQTFESVAAAQGLEDTSTAVIRQVTASIEAAATQMADAVVQLETVATREIDVLSHRWWPVLIGIGALGIAGIAFFIARIASGPASAIPDPTSVLVTIGAGLGFLHVRQQKGVGTAAVQAQGTATKDKLGDTIATVKTASAATPAAGSTASGGSFADRVSGLFGQEASAVMEAFDKGFRQIENDLAGLSYAVAVTYPLIQYFALDVQFISINADYDFMTQIIWDQADRQDEVRRVALAAFGPLGLLALAKANKNAPDTTNQNPNAAPLL